MADEQNTPEGTLAGRIEAVLYVTGEPVRATELAKALRVTEKELWAAVHALRDEYNFQQRGFTLNIYGGHIQLATRPLYAADVVHLLQPVQKQSLSQAVMETLAVVAYKQPVTKAEVEQVRGVRCDYSIQSLVSKGLIAEVGRKDAVGHPILYGTTDEFLRHFGISSLQELPPMPDKAPTEEPADPVEEFMT